MHRFLPLCLTAALAIAATPATSPSAPAKAADAGWPDQCAALPGYPEFRARLVSAVRGRDAAAFRKLFALGGAIRFNGLGIGSDDRLWDPASPSGRAVWDELDQLVDLGCEHRGGRLTLPYLAVLGEETGLEPGSVIVVRDAPMLSKPRAGAAVARRLKRGMVLSLIDPYVANTMSKVRLRGGHVGYVARNDVRSPYGTVLQIAQERGRWAIVWFGGNA